MDGQFGGVLPQFATHQPSSTVAETATHPSASPTGASLDCSMVSVEVASSCGSGVGLACAVDEAGCTVHDPRPASCESRL